MGVRMWIKKLPFKAQVLLSAFLVGVFLIDLVVPDLVPLVDELFFGSLAFSSLAATFASMRRRGPAESAPELHRPAPVVEEDPFVIAAQQEVEAALGRAG